MKMFEELIKVENDKVSAKELHKALEVKTRFNDWFARMKEYGFEENKDFRLVTQKRATNNPKNPITTYIDYEITLDAAKEISMIQRTSKGKEVREYFIQCEKESQRLKEEILN